MSTRALGRYTTLFQTMSACLVLALLTLTGCGLFTADVPPEVVAASEGQAQIIEAQAANEIDLINAYEADLIAAYDAHSQERLDSLIAKGGYDTPEKVKGLVVAFTQNRDRYRAESEARKAKFTATCAANAKSGKALNEATRKYLDTLGDARKNLAAVIKAIPAPTTRPTGGS
jgi:hypothetical protein